MWIILILAAMCLICITLFIIKQETPEDRTNDEKYKNASHTMRDTIKEIRNNIKEIDMEIKNKKAETNNDDENKQEWYKSSKKP